MLALLIDPDKVGSQQSLIQTVEKIENSRIDFIFIGGSIVSQKVDSIITTIKSNSKIPVVLFPGSFMQISEKADGILFLSLLSGRNPDYLIGNHVIASQFLKQSGIEIIPTGYLLIDGGSCTSVEYISNTKPIPADKADIAVATALAGEMLGLKAIYIDAGSGAKNPISKTLIIEVRKNITVPLFVGGGIKTVDSLINAYTAGADLVVIGSAFEENENLIREFSEICEKF